MATQLHVWLEDDTAVLFEIVYNLVRQRHKDAGLGSVSQRDVVRAIITAYCTHHAEDIVGDLATAQERNEFLRAIESRNVRCRRHPAPPASTGSAEAAHVPGVAGPG